MIIIYRWLFTTWYKNYETDYRSLRVQFLTISGYLGLSQGVVGYLELSWALIRYLGLSFAISGYRWLSLFISGCLWISLVIFGYLRLSLSSIKSYSAISFYVSLTWFIKELALLKTKFLSVKLKCNCGSNMKRSHSIKLQT